MIDWSGSFRIDELPRRRGWWPGALIAIMALVTSALVIAFVIVPRARRETRERWKGELTLRAETRQASIQEWLRAWRADASVIAAYPSVRAFASATDDEQLGSHVAEVLETFGRNNTGCGVAVVDGDGGLVPLVGGAMPRDPHLDAAIRETLASGEQVVRFGTPAGMPVVAVTAPVRGGDSSSVVRGAVVLFVDPGPWLYPFLSIRPSSVFSSDIYLVQPDGSDTQFISPVRFSNAAPGTLRTPRTSGRLAASAALRGESAVGEYLDYRGEHVLAAPRPISGTPFGLVLEVDVSEIDREALRQAAYVGFWVALTGLLIASAAIVLNRRVEHAALLERNAHLERFALVLDQASDAVLFVAGDGTLLAANRRATLMYERTSAELRGLPVAELSHESARAELDNDMRKLTERGEATFRTLHRRRDGSPFPVEVSSRTTEIKGTRGFIAIVRDISGQVETENRIEQLTRMFRTLSKINELIVRTNDRHRLLAAACEVIVREAKLPLAWIGRAEEDGSVTVAASAGASASYLDGLVFRWDRTPEGLAPIGVALREQRVDVEPDIGREARMAPWSEKIRAAGFGSALAVPVSPGGRRHAALAIYSTEAGYFDAELRGVVEDLAADLAFAIEAMERREDSERQRRVVETIVEGSPVPIYSIDRDGLVTSWNAASVKVFGWSAAEVLGRPLPNVPPDRHDENRAFLAGVLRGEPVQRRFVRRMKRDGSRVELELSVAVLRDADGAVAGAVAVALDVTEARAVEVRARALFDLGVIGTLYGDVEGRILDANDEFLRIVGYTRAELETGAVRWDAITPPEWLPLDFERVAEARANGRCTPYEKEYVRKDGTRVPVVVGYQLLEPERVESIAFILDISALKAAERELRELNAELEKRVANRTRALEEAVRDLESFSYSVSHDLRAPLRAIDGFSRILEEEHSSQLDDEAKRLLSVVRASTRSMGRLIDDLLSFSRAGRRPMQPVRVAMRKLVESVWLEFPEDQRGGVDFVLGDLPDAEGDAALLHQVWWNLLENALKYSTPKPSRRIEAGAEREEGRTRYYVRDNGVGFDARFASKLFGVFERLHSARDFEGTGVGLAIVRRIVERHGGSVRAESGEGGGATFSFTLG